MIYNNTKYTIKFFYNFIFLFLVSISIVYAYNMDVARLQRDKTQ